MGARYWLYNDEFKKHSEVVDKGEPIEMEIMDQEEKVWTQARVMVFRQPTEGAQPGGLLGPFGEPFGEGRLYIKVLEQLASPLEEE